MGNPNDVTVEWTGRFLRSVKRGAWEFVQRTNASGVVAIVAVTPARELVIVEQDRPAVGARVVEIPAGLAGDAEAHAGEPLRAAAERELEEETGYRAARWVELFTGLTSAGMSDEAVTFYFADGLTRVGEGGGEAGSDEDITVHHVPLDGLLDWVRSKRHAGVHCNATLFAGVGAARAAGLL